MKRPIFSKFERATLLAALRVGSAYALVTLGLAVGLAMVSYDPADPGLFNATWRGPNNWLGPAGADTADLLQRMLGVAGYGVAVFALVWGARLHQQALPDHTTRRLIAAPLALAAGAALASSHAETALSGGGLGGLVGDTLFGVTAMALPVESDRVRLVSAALVFAALTPPLTISALGGRLRPTLALIVASFVMLWNLTRAAGAAAADALAFAFGAPSQNRCGDRWTGWPAPEIGGAPPAPAAAPMQSDATDPFWWSGWKGVERAPIEPPFEAADVRRVPKAPPRHEDGRQEPLFPEVDAPETTPETPSAVADAAQDGGSTTDALGVAALSVRPPLPAWAAAAADAGDALSSYRRDVDQQMLATIDVTGDVVDRTSEEPVKDAAKPAKAAHHDLSPTAGPPSPPSLDAAFEDAPVGEKEATSLHDTHRVPAADVLPALAVATPTQAAPAEGRTARGPSHLTPPSLDLLAGNDSLDRPQISERALADKADRLQAVLSDYGVRGDIIHVNPGPVVSLFELEPAPGLKASRVIGLADDIARSMSAVACRVAPVPGKNLIGIELPNEIRETVLLSDLLSAPAYRSDDWVLPLALGKDIGGEPVIADLARMPHLLIAGTTGSGKSVAINTMLLSLLYRLSPDDVRLILIDPKMLELSVYNGAPHLLAPVVTDPMKAVSALRWVVREMESRYQRMARLNVRSLESYNRRVAECDGAIERDVQVGFDEATGRPLFETQRLEAAPMPRIVVVIDEMADLMLVAGKEIERLVQRLAQMARASGIHLIMATQRPSVDVITGVIKANFPIRVSFQVSSKIDSRTILNEPGAEQLLGKGDMLYTTGAGKLRRLHGPFVSDAEVEAVASALCAMGGLEPPVDFDVAHNDDSATDAAGRGAATEADEADGDDALYDRAVAIVTRERKASTSFLQRRLQIGYNRAARLVDRMEAEGVISEANHVGKRSVLAPPAPE